VTQLVRIEAPTLPALVSAAGDRAGVRFLEFFAANIRNPHTRRAYARAMSDFLSWCADAGVASVADVQPLHVATWIETQSRERAAASSLRLFRCKILGGCVKTLVRSAAEQVRSAF
jgi:site-specific recombinase XerC